MLPDSRFLDEQIPLDGASFGDVAELGVDIPTRYAECYALLADGRRLRLRHRDRFLGRSESGHRRRLFFTCDDGRILCLRTNTRRKRPIRGVECWERFALCRAFSSADEAVQALGRRVVRVVAVDGSLLFISPDSQPAGSSQNTLERIGELLRLPPVLVPRHPA